MLNFEMMNISRRRRFIIDDEPMNKNKNIHEDMVVSSSSTHNIDGDDLIMEILLRLPPIVVHRFRRVCKQWYTLISNPDFLRTHSSPFQLLHNNSSTIPPSHEHDHQLLVFISPRVGGGGLEFVPLTQFQEQEDQEQNYRKQPPPLLKQFLLDLSIDSVVVSPPDYDEKQVYKVHFDLVDSCNGLFLLHSFGTHYICNPITKHYFKLPDINPIQNAEDENLIHSKHASLVFDPSISLSYKVIRYILGRSRFRYRNNLHCQMYVYSSETCSWKHLSTRIPDPTIIPKSEDFRRVLLNGVLYCSYSYTEKDVSVCFDVEKECVWFLSLPPKPQYYVRYCLYFGKCDGRLRLIERFESRHERRAAYFNDLPCRFDIMEAEPQQQDGDIWTVKYHVDIRKIYDFFHKEHASVIHCYKTKDRRGNEEEVLLVRLNHRSIVSFNLTSKKFIKVIADSERTELSCLRDPHAYTPILFPVS